MKPAPFLALALVSCGPKIDKGPVRADVISGPVHVVARPDAGSPNVYFQAVVASGSAYDPTGEEGLADLTARSMLEAGAGERSGQQVKEALYPTGNDIELVVDREWTSFRLTCHRDHAKLCLELFTDVVTRPRFDAADVERVRDEAKYEVGEGLLANEEALGMEVLNAWLYEAHPYGHPARGRTGVLDGLGADDVKAYHAAHFVRGTVTGGLAGSFDPELQAAFQSALDALPATTPPELVLLDPPSVDGRHLLAVDTATPVTGFHFGYPLPVRRAHDDWPELFVAFTAFGEHRQSHGRLFRTLRTDRGLNYGDYAYVEPFVQRGWSSMPEQGVLRRQPFLYVWLRPTGVENGAFALKLAVDELEKLVANGLTQQEFDDIQRYLKGKLPLLADDPGRRLAFVLDAEVTGQPDLLDALPKALETMTVEDVNAALKRHVKADDLRIVAVSGEAEALVKQIVEGTETPIVYAEGITPSPEQAARDAEIAGKKLEITADRAKVVPAEGIFR